MAQERGDDRHGHGRRPRLDVEVTVIDDDDQGSSKLSQLLHKVNQLMATQAELAADLNAVRDQVAKIGGETAATLQKVIDLEAALVAAGNTSPEVDAAVAAVKDQVKVVDDMIADVEPTPTP